MKNKTRKYGIVVVMLVISMFFLPTTWATPQTLSLVPSTALPDHFDLRDVNGTNYVTGIRDQGPYGTCWTHGVMASMEGNLLMTGNWVSAGEEGEPSLSEAHLDWWNGFNDQNNDDDPGGAGIPVHYGGDYLVASAYITRGEGAIREIDAPYENLEVAPLRYDSTYHYYYPHDIEWYYTDYNLTNIDTIKKTLMEYGVIGTAFCVGGFMQNYIQYQPPSDTQDPNHAVAIVGWNDTLVTQAPEGPGAWIVKNSWGQSWGHEGYFYISYYDKWCGHHPQMGAVSYQNVISLQNRVIYSHDYHGWRDTFTSASKAFNMFTAQSDSMVDAISFYTTVDNVDYTVKIYDEFIGGQLSGELSTKSGFIEHKGYHTIDLSTPVATTAGDEFYVFIDVSQGGIAFDRTSDVPVLLGGDTRTIVKSIAHADESYYWDGASWIDFYTYEFQDPNWDGTANFCIKALTASEKAPILTFESFTGGKGITTVVKNIGTENATDIHVAINGTGGLFLRFPQSNYTIDTLACNDSAEIVMKVFGFGIGLIKPLPTLTLRLSALNANTVTRQIAVKVIGPFITIVD